MGEEKYKVILDTMPETESRLEVLFRQAGDGFLQVEYGRIQRAALQDSFRMLAVNDIIQDKKIKGLIETVPGLRTNLFHFDPEVLSLKELMVHIKEAEDSMPTVDDVVLHSRLIHLPMAFEDSETKKAVAKYAKEVRPDAPNIIDGYNIEYIALCNGVTVYEFKEMFLGTDWFNSGGGFWPGGAFLWPTDPRCAIVVPKYNPPRTWTPEGAVGIGGPCVFTYTTPTGGGYQLFGRTIPTFQFAQKHPIFQNGPFLYKPADRVRFHEVTEAEVLEIYDHVHNQTDYEYKIDEGKIVVKDYLAWYNSEKVQAGMKALKAKQAEGVKKAPRL
ncbi:MAG: carboxyltransferase domain-containing protein [Deltaproteobacteria bacterium]|nr:carboxyltransferase domain-containing protein [Deltaproteobacteria bacterium]